MQHSAFAVRIAGRVAIALLAVGASACTDAIAPGGAAPEGDATAPSQPAFNPLAGRALWVPSWSQARITAGQWRASRPADAALMDRIAEQAQAQWFGDWNADIRGDVDRVVTAAAAASALPVMVAYNIPMRDCGSYSAGGAASAAAYRGWIGGYAAGLAGRPALVVLEPDALAGLGCLPPAEQSTRFDLLRFAVETLRNAGALVYLDAGHNRWLTPSTVAERLRRAGVELASGFSLNVSNFFSTSEETAYGEAISRLVGGKRYVIDTSRNGLGATADAQWCNPEGRALGPRPTSFTGRSLVDAFLWVKVPGESDGSCNGYPAAGTWLPEYALGLARRAAW